MSFGFVESPLITVVEDEAELTLNNSLVGTVGANSLYWATFHLSTNLTDPSIAPIIRLRASSESFQRSDLLIVSSEHSGSFSPTNNGRFYSSYFVIPENEDKFRLNFDVLSFEPRDTKHITFSLGYVDVEYVGTTDSLTNETPVMNTDFVAEGQSGWQALPIGPMPIQAPSIYTANVGEGLLIKGVGSEAIYMGILPNAVFGFWGGDLSELPLEQALYRVRWTIGSDILPGNEQLLPTFRLRFNDDTLKFASMVNIESAPTNNNLPTADNPVTYDSWFQIPPQVAGNDWKLSFDYLYVNKPEPEADDPAAALILKNVEVTKYSIP